MPPSRDEQDYESRRRQIIDGALHVFAGKGFEKATNKDIASAAGIGSPGLIYHYFKDKKDLFKQVVETYAPALQLIARGEEMMDMPPREALTLFATTFVSMLDNRAAMAMFKMMLGEAVRRPAVGEIFNTIGPGRGFPFLVRYFSHQMDKGTLRRMDPGAAVRCFIGPLIVYILSREVFVQTDAQTLSPEKMVETAVDIFLHGLAVPPNK
ncbi:MAG TPA: TetR/AcrR family transcriptional regulator [Chloroflexia bacterium]|nr:TetR/AcrR family transcriptional regulator [Chloroflexia bacterium]